MKYAYIDESGTREDQRVMTVALIVLDGKRTAEKAHEKAICELYPDYVDRRRQFKRGAIRYLPDLHYAEMDRRQRQLVGAKLAEIRIEAYVSYHHHDGQDATHDERFGVYKHLVKEAIRLATVQNNELSVTIAQQGGWQGYEREFQAEIKALEYERRGDAAYRKLAVSFEPAKHPGIQLADFYAGSSRDYLMDPDNDIRLVHYRRIEMQILMENSTLVRT